MLGAALLVASGGYRASAQSPALRANIVQDWSQMKDRILQLVEAMPEEKFGFKPTPELRTYGEQLLHVADDNVNLLKLLGSQVPAPAIDRTATTKQAIAKAVVDSFDYGAAVLAKETETSILAPVHLSNWEGTHAGLVWAAIGHAWDEYGVMTVYLRLNDIVPPASRRK